MRCDRSVSDGSEIEIAQVSLRTARAYLTIGQCSTYPPIVKIYFIGAVYISGTRKLRYTLMLSTFPSGDVSTARAHSDA